MSFYPIISAPGCIGQTTLYNFSPNNWEKRSENKACIVNLTWAFDGVWNSVVLDELSFGKIVNYKRSDISAFLPEDSLPLLSMSSLPLPKFSEILPKSLNSNHMPNWRATLSLISPFALTSYQGELDAFPETGSLLTFAPFIQFGEEVENYMLFLNLEKNPQKRRSKLEIYNSVNPSFILGDFTVSNNTISKIRLDDLGFSHEDLPVIICKNMAGIPLYFSKTTDGAFLSLEHTHPPASLVILGERWEAQKILKKEWFTKIHEKSY
jgi:hypothetical protein